MIRGLDRARAMGTREAGQQVAHLGTCVQKRHKIATGSVFCMFLSVSPGNIVF